MNRRTFLSSLSIGAASASSAGAQFKPYPAKGLRLSITCDMFRGPDRGLPEDSGKTEALGRTTPGLPMQKYSPDEGLALAHATGYQAFEMFNWRAPSEFEAYAKAQKKWGLDCACITVGQGVRAPGCSLTDPADREGFLQELQAGIAAGKKMGTKRLVVLSGMEREGVSRAEQLDSCVATMKAAAPMLEKSGMTAILEPINTRVTRPGFFLSSAWEAFGMLERVSSPNVKLLFDLYHVQITDGHLMPQIRNKIRLIDHFQIGDHPGRHEPGTGEIHHRNIFRLIYDLQQAGKYSGYVGLEYYPTVPLGQTMGAVRQLANFP